MNLAKTKIIQQLGYFPAFLTPALEFPKILRSLVQQTLVAYEQNPLPTIFKEKLFVYISHYYGVSYFAICHSCTLRSQNISALEILALEKIQYPQSLDDIQPDLKILGNQSEVTTTVFSHSLEASLLRCASFLFSSPQESVKCVTILQKFLGLNNYNYLVLLLGYIKLCHHWINDHPRISHEQDRRSQLHLGALLLSQPKLAIFFQKNRIPASTFKTSNKLDLQSKSSSLRLKLEPKTKTIRNNALKIQLEPLEDFINYLKSLSFPVMASSDSEEILFLNSSWFEATDYDLEDVKTLDEWQEKAQVEVESISLSQVLANFDNAGSATEIHLNQIKEAAGATPTDIPNLAATQAALSKRTQQLEAANRELESFSYSVSHDLQAPLRVISGFSQVLSETCKDSLDDRGQHFIERIQTNSQKMSDLIDALLELSRVTRSQMKSIKVNLSEMAQDILQELQTESPDRQVDIKIEPGLEVQGDPQLLRIVLDNLLNNAWKYTSKRSQAQIEFNLLAGEDNNVAYYVRDNGAGFDPDYVDKLFNPFQRLHCQSEFPGTGIGLATAQRIIYRHGGRVWAEGESDRGATIYFAL